jgi:glycosyltransferase involved in cell wall biosynthesis
VKILIVAAFFPPQNSIASLRPYTWAKYWSCLGHDVTVITTTKKKTPTDLNLDCSSFNVISLEIPLLSFLSHTLRKRNDVNIGGKKNQKRTTNKTSILQYLKKSFSRFSYATGCFYSVRFPDFHDFWVLKAKKALKSDNYDMVVSTSGPYSTHRVGYHIKKHNSRIKWVVDLRDYWTESRERRGLFIFRQYEKCLEYKFFKNADLITTVSDQYAEVFRKKTKTPVITIFNGFDKDDYNNIIQNSRIINKKFTIVYTGTLYRDYHDPSPLFEAVRNLNNRSEISENDLQIIFVGNNADVTDLASKYMISNYFSYRGIVSRENALSMQYNADIALLLGKESLYTSGNLSGKIFEYLYIAKMIWAIGITNKMQAGEIIEETGTGYCFGNSVVCIEKAIIDSVKTRNENSLNKNIEKISQYDRKAQAERLLLNIKIALP